MKLNSLLEMRKGFNTGYIKRGHFLKEKDVPFIEHIPLKLSDRVSTRGSGSGKVACVQEMFVLFRCLKRFNFEDTGCANEAKQFQKCYEENAIAMKNKPADYVPGQKKLTRLQVNQFLKQFPSK